jgi:hypothetical protein
MCKAIFQCLIVGFFAYHLGGYVESLTTNVIRLDASKWSCTANEDTIERMPSERHNWLRIPQTVVTCTQYSRVTAKPL